MRKNNFLVGIAVFLFCVLLIYVGVTFYFEWTKKDGTETETDADTESERDSDPTDTQETVVYEYVGAVDEEVLMTGKDEKYLLLANKRHPLRSDYAPSQLSFLPETLVTKDEQLESRTAAALTELMKEMHACGITDTLVTSAYRSYERQCELFNRYIQTEIACVNGFSEEALACLGYSYLREQYTNKGLHTLSYEDARRVVLTYSAEPGTSEHQTGLCVDFITEDMNGHLTTVFEEKEAFDWLSENAYKFGFILRYPKGKEGITGYTYEPWHYRFVGREAATEIHLNGLTLEEYLGLENE
ncbi:MAG: M15 family metallopeptidase [Clostridia bacterium]|nr:M15 family metallopeptidase [Clostridia bacterium]